MGLSQLYVNWEEAGVANDIVRFEHYVIMR